MSHTPGPWSVEFGENAGYDCMSSAYTVSVEGRIYRPIATLDVREYVRNNDDYDALHAEHAEAAANSKLIAAAPELLDACDMSMNTLLGCCVAGGGVDDRKTMLETIAMLRAAMTKALGK